MCSLTTYTKYASYMHGIAKQVPKTLMRIYNNAIVDVFLEMTDGPDIPYDICFEAAASDFLGDAAAAAASSSASEAAEAAAAAAEVVIIASKPCTKTTGIRKQRKRRMNYSNMVVPFTFAPVPESEEFAFAFAPSTPVMITPPITMFYETYPIL